MDKNKIRALLIKMRTNENKEAVNHILGLIDMKSDEEIEAILTKNNITEENIEDVLVSRINIIKTQQEQSDPFIGINKMFCYGRTGNTLHMHLIPKDLRGLKAKLGDEAFYQYFKDQLEDFLSRMQDIVRDDDSVETLFAVSPIFFNKPISSAHEQLGFDEIKEIDLENNDDNMSKKDKQHFIDMFGGKKKVYYTGMTRDKLLESEYKRIQEEEKDIEEE